MQIVLQATRETLWEKNAWPGRNARRMPGLVRNARPGHSAGRCASTSYVVVRVVESRVHLCIATGPKKDSYCPGPTMEIPHPSRTAHPFAHVYYRRAGPRRRRGCDSTREWAHSITHPCRCARTASNAHVGVVARRCVSSERGGASVPWRQSRRANPKLVEGACRTPYILPPLHSYICIVTFALA